MSMLPVRVLLFTVFVLLVGLTQSALAQLLVSDIKILPLGGGLHTFTKLGPEVPEVTVLRAWRENGDWHAYSIYIVLVSDDDYGSAPLVVGLHEGDDLGDVIRDFPHRGDNNVRTVEFASGKVDGVPSFLTIIAQRYPKMGYDGAAPATIDIYQLQNLGVEPGATPYVLEPVSHVETKRTYCTSVGALYLELGLPLKDDGYYEDLEKKCQPITD